MQWAKELPGEAFALAGSHREDVSFFSFFFGKSQCRAKERVLESFHIDLNGYLTVEANRLERKAK